MFGLENFKISVYFIRFILQPGARCWHYYFNWLVKWKNYSCRENNFSTVFLSLFLKSDHNSIPIDLTKSMFMVFWTFIVIVAFCEIGEMVCNQFNSFHAKLIECNWYFYPNEMQRMFAIFMSDTQQQTNIRGLGNILCARCKVKQVKK